MLTIAEKARIARRTLGAVAQIMQPAPDQMEQLTFALAKILNVEAKDVVDGAKLDFMLGQLGLVKVGLAAALVGLSTLGAKVVMPPEVAEGLGLQTQERSSIITPG